MIEDDLTALNAKTANRLRDIANAQPTPESRQPIEAIARQLESTGQTGKPASGPPLSIEQVAASANAASRELQELRDKAIESQKALDKIRDRSNVPRWLTWLVIGGFIAWLVYAAAKPPAKFSETEIRIARS